CNRFECSASPAPFHGRSPKGDRHLEDSEPVHFRGPPLTHPRFRHPGRLLYDPALRDKTPAQRPEPTAAWESFIVKTAALFFPFDLFGSPGAGKGAELLADAFREMLADNQREQVPTRARAYQHRV